MIGEYHEESKKVCKSLNVMILKYPYLYEYGADATSKEQTNFFLFFIFFKKKGRAYVLFKILDQDEESLKLIEKHITEDDKLRCTQQEMIDYLFLKASHIDVSKLCSYLDISYQEAQKNVVATQKNPSFTNECNVVVTVGK